MPTNHAERAMLLMAAATLTLPGIDAIAKYLAGSIESGQVTWSRFLFQTFLLAPFMWRLGARARNPNILVHSIRGLLIASATLLFFTALKYMPIADTIAIFFVEPLLLTLLSAVVLKETVGWRRFCAVGVGLAASGLIIKPQFVTLGATALLPLGAATCFAVYLVLTRKFAGQDHPVTMQFYAGIAGLVGMTVALLLGHDSDLNALSVALPSTFEWLLLFTLGVIATIGHLLITKAFTLANASLLAPFQYLELVTATILGLWLFGDFPDATTWVGIAIIVASGLYVFHRERVRGDASNAQASKLSGAVDPH